VVATAHRRLDAAADDADIGQRAVVELVELADGLAQAARLVDRGDQVADDGLEPAAPEPTLCRREDGNSWVPAVMVLFSKS
jgi:hypothetical protein